MNFKSNNLILLTGAGFTKNFGGFLGSEMWSLIYNHPLIQNHQKIKDLLLAELNYEYAYNIVLDSKFYNEEERNTIKQVVEDAYRKLDDSIKKWNFNDSNPNSLNIYGLRKFLSFFNGSGQEKGFVFTLNQDILMERQFNCMSLGMLPISKIPFLNFEKEHFQRTPDASNIKKDISSCGNRIFIKLHGSYGWLSSNGENQMVIGGDKMKSKHINKEPLLKWYFKIFKEVIEQGNKKIVIIGYGFKDNHINNLLLEGIEKYNLKLCVIDSISPLEFRTKTEKIFKEKDFITFWKTLNYFPHTLVDIFPHDQQQHPTALFQSIKEAISS